MPTTFTELVDTFLSIITSLVYFIFAITFLFFVWQMIKMWIIGGGDEKSVADGKQVLLATIIGLVVMSGLWGILTLLRSGLF
jgi:hypothetical protein